MKISKLLKRLDKINNLLKNIENVKAKDLEYEIKHIGDEIELLVDDVDSFGVEEDE